MIDPTGVSSGTAGFAGTLGDRDALQEPSGTKWNY
jgi:hypothetical protein